MLHRRTVPVLVLLVAIAAAGVFLVLRGSSARVTGVPGGPPEDEAPKARTAAVRRKPILEPQNPPDAGSEDGFGEVVESQGACQDKCGTECLTDPKGRLRCPGFCKSDQDCGGAQPLCTLTEIAASGHRYWRCLGSNCPGATPEGDKACGPQRTCKYMGRLEGGIYRCEDAGERKAGEPCGPVGYAAVGACAPGLRCANGTCMPRCVQDSDCPRGTKCGELAGGATHRECVPACTDDASCPDGKKCVELPWGTRMCTKLDKPTCLQTGCPEGTYCDVEEALPWEVVASCQRKCVTPGEDGPCGPRGFCDVPLGLNDLVVQARCYTRCSKTSPCPSGQKCVEFDGDFWYCAHDGWASVDRFFSENYDPK